MPAAGARAHRPPPGTPADCESGPPSASAGAGLRSRRSRSHHLEDLRRRVGLSIGLSLTALALGACAPRDPSPVRIVNLVRDVGAAEARPSRAAFEVADVSVAGRSEPSIRTIAPSRLVFVLPVPRRSAFVAQVAIEGGIDGAPPQPLRFRVGVSDDRIYEPLADVVLTPGVLAGWTPLRADLSAYAGWQWSVFYRPEAERWRLVLSTDALAGVPGRGVWGAPGIDGDRSAAREHVERAARMSRDH